VAQNLYGLSCILVGIPVAVAFQLFSNPKHEEDFRFDMAAGVLVMSAMWPVTVVMLIVFKSWQDYYHVRKELESQVEDPAGGEKPDSGD